MERSIRQKPQTESELCVLAQIVNGASVSVGIDTGCTDDDDKTDENEDDEDDEDDDKQRNSTGHRLTLPPNNWPLKTAATSIR